MSAAEEQRARLKTEVDVVDDNYALAYWREIARRRRAGLDDDGFE